MFSNQKTLLSSLKDSLAIAQLHGFRVMLVLAGHNDKQQQTALSAISECLIEPSGIFSLETETQRTVNIMHVPDMHSNSDVSDQINALLGSEYRCLVFDAHGVFNERLFAAAAGTVQAGGLLILQTPALEMWPAAQQVDGIPSAFITRLVAKIKAHSVCTLSLSDDDLTEQAIFIRASNIPALFVSTDIEPPRTWQSEQQNLIESLLDKLSTDTASVNVVQGDRGRGKSALIGRTINKLIKAGITPLDNICVTAHRRSAADVLMKHAGHPLPFLPLDSVLGTSHDILIVEEAGGIPLATLERLLYCGKQIVFATTVQGYEGSGRGFALRFSRMLDATKPGWLKLNPTQPIRWSIGDPVEAFINDALLLETQITPLTDANTQLLQAVRSRTRLIDTSELVENDKLLNDVFGLLLQAHYQTTPTDLRNLLDQTDLLVFVQHIYLEDLGHVLTGAALVAIEGEIAPHLHTAIVQKHRRLPDQILPQLLAQTIADISTLSTRFARIVRIAVHPNIQGNGFGTALYKSIEQQLPRSASVPLCLGASFGADEQSLSFWLKLGLTPIHYGYKSNPRSGLRSACLLTSDDGEMQDKIGIAASVLSHNLEAIKNLPSIDKTVMEALREASNTAIKLRDKVCARLIHAYSLGHRSFFDSAGLILTFPPLASDSALHQQVMTLLIDYAQMPPKTRREQETQLRRRLIENIDFESKIGK